MYERYRWWWPRDRLTDAMVEMGDPARWGAGRAFVGRDREVAELVAGLEDAVGGRGRLFLIAGEPGIGKTWLAEDLAGHAMQRGVRVLWGRCWEGGGAPPFWPWAQMIGALAEDCDEQTLAAWLGAGAGSVAQVVPGLTERLGTTTIPSVPSRESDAARFYLFEAVVGLFKRAASVQPLLLVFDDLHAADDPSLLLLEFLARELRGAPLLVVGTYRDVAAAQPPGVGSRGREGPHRRALRRGAVRGEAGRDPRGDRGQPAVRPGGRAPAGYRGHPGPPGSARRADPGQCPGGDPAAACAAVRRRRSGAIGRRGGGLGVRPGAGRARLRAAGRAGPWCAVRGGGPGRDGRGPGHRRRVPLLALPDARGALRAAADPGPAAGAPAGR